MQAETPATGIMKTHDWGKTKTYRVICECSGPECEHNVWVEADETSVNVTIYTTTKSKFWSLNRWQQIWTLLTQGYIELETSLIMSEQRALNYAETLKSAIIDVKEFKK